MKRSSKNDDHNDGPHRPPHMKLPLVTDAKAETATLRVCWHRRTFPDDRCGKCAFCNRTIYWRPHGPHSMPKICMQCMLEHYPPGEKMEIMTTRTTLAELAAAGVDVEGVES